MKLFSFNQDYRNKKSPNDEFSEAAVCRDGFITGQRNQRERESSSVCTSLVLLWLYFLGFSLWFCGDSSGQSLDFVTESAVKKDEINLKLGGNVDTSCLMLAEVSQNWLFTPSTCLVLFISLDRSRSSSKLKLSVPKTCFYWGPSSLHL